jgi:NTP pyrophosphatase (non-canonical NTP hydrolase)
MTADVYAVVHAAASWLDEHNGACLPAREDPACGHAELMARILKVTEEAGEVAAAWIGATGQNPHKGVTHTYADVAAELADVVFTALVAIDSLGFDPADAVAACAAKVTGRLDVPAMSGGTH